MLVCTLHLMLDVFLVSAKAALCADSQITVLKCVHYQNSHVDTTLTTITNKHICECSVCNKTWYKSKVVSSNPLALLVVKMV